MDFNANEERRIAHFFLTLRSFTDIAQKCLERKRDVPTGLVAQLTVAIDISKDVQDSLENLKSRRELETISEVDLRNVQTDLEDMRLNRGNHATDPGRAARVEKRLSSTSESTELHSALLKATAELDKVKKEMAQMKLSYQMQASGPTETRDHSSFRQEIEALKSEQAVRLEQLRTEQEQACEQLKIEHEEHFEKLIEECRVRVRAKVIESAALEELVEEKQTEIDNLKAELRNLQSQHNHGERPPKAQSNVGPVQYQRNVQQRHFADADTVENLRFTPMFSSGYVNSPSPAIRDSQSRSETSSPTPTAYLAANDRIESSSSRPLQGTKRRADAEKEVDTYRMPLDNKRQRLASSSRTTPKGAQSMAASALSSVQPEAATVRIKITDDEMQKRANSILTLMQLDWDAADAEVKQLTEQMTSLFSRNRSVDDLKQAIDKHVVGNFLKDPANPRPCLFGVLTNEGGGPGNTMRRSNCPYCKKVDKRVCVWAEYPQGVASGFGPRDPGTGRVTDTKWRQHPTPYTIDRDGHQTRWILKKRTL